MTFDDLNLNKPLRNALADLGYVQPTPIQIEAFPVIMSGKDVVGIAQTGTGKTFAYLLPLLRLLTFSKERHPRILIIVPTRELVKQLVEEIEQLTTYMSVRVAGVYGGANINTQKKIVYEGLDILVATPGRLVDLVMHGALRLKAIKKFVIDEVDELLQLGFRSQLTTVLDLLPQRRQNLMFSATLTKEVDEIIDTFFTLVQKIEIAAHGTPLEQINQQVYHVPNFFTKANLLEILIQDKEEFNKVLVFVGNKRLADRLFKLLIEKFPEEIGVIHSNKSQNNRFKTVERFQDGTHRVLIATDIISRGLDIVEVSHVINSDMPETPADYMHRIGRTGRADKEGIAISFVTDEQAAQQMAIEELMQKNIPIQDLPEGLVISTELLEEEMPKMEGDKNYLKNTSLKQTQGAFHEKKEKNQKINLGGSWKRKVKAKNKKITKRSGGKKKR